MKALVWHGKEDVRCDKGVPDPKIEDPRDAIVKITATAICGSDLHLYDGYMPTRRAVTCSVTSRWAKSWKWARETKSSGWATAW
jgi:threonine dehydrogenase-like Zn-dependent dehydrogenase